MDDQIYREIILEHWKNPQNYGVIADADIDISDSNPLCGDEILITASLVIPLKKGIIPPTTPKDKNDPRIREDDNVIAEIKFIGQGCAISKASASLFTEFIKGKSITEIKNLTQEEALQLLTIMLTSARLKCALLPYSTLQKALEKV